MSEGTSHGGRRNWRRIGIGLIIVAAWVLALGWGFRSLRAPAGFVDPPYPTPNGYEDLLRAGQMIVGQPPGPKGDIRKASAAELRQWIEANQEALKVAREALRHESRVVVPPSIEQVSAYMQRIGEVKQLCRLKGAEARLAELEGCTMDVVKNSLDAVRLAQEGTRGGLMQDALNGFACETYGTAVLTRVRDQLSAAQCREVIEALDEVDRRREPTDRVVARDRAWSTRDYNVFARTARAISPAANKMIQSSVTYFETSRRQSDARLRLLSAELAIRCYRLDNGSDPPNIEALAVRVPFEGPC